MLRIARFLTAYLAPGDAAAPREMVVDLGDREAPALLFLPRSRRPLPGWVMLHGITVPGIRHPAMLRFARALAGSGSVVLVPEVTEWKELRIAPRRAETVIAAAARHLAERPEVRGGGVGVVGFSFGATQAVATAARPGMGDAIRSVAAFGAYCDLRRTLHFMLAGEHEWEGVRRRLDPDPYGRWIVAANYLTAVPEFAGMGRVADAARTLAADAGRRFVYAGDPRYDPLKAELARGLDPEERRVWEAIAPPAGAPLDAERGGRLAERIAAAAVAADPELDPRPVLPSFAGRLVLAHGLDDRLVPFTETLRLASHLPSSADVSVTVTRLFAHSRGAGGMPWTRYPGEVWRYVRLLHRVLRP